MKHATILTEKKEGIYKRYDDSEQLYEIYNYVC